MTTKARSVHEFQVKFNNDTPELERKFYNQTFPSVDLITQSKVHCTACDVHIGTAPIAEASMYMHPILRVTYCRKCSTFYNSGEFSRGEDGSELYCRWCGQGGEVFCCSQCPFVFCKKCILRNLSRKCVNDIINNENWKCFRCSPRIMWQLRAEHWALTNFIEKQKEQVSLTAHSEDEITEMMNRDQTTCCGLRIPKIPSTSHELPAPCGSRKRSNQVTKNGQLPQKKTKHHHQKEILTALDILSKSLIKSAKPQQKSNAEVVCTPDIMSMFNATPVQISRVSGDTAASSKLPLLPKQPSSLTTLSSPIRRFKKIRPNKSIATPSTDNNITTSPVYHVINGFKVDLNMAAKLGSYRLPNGKVITVRKQSQNMIDAQSQLNATTIAPSPQQLLQPSAPIVAEMPPNNEYILPVAGKTVQKSPSTRPYRKLITKKIKAIAPASPKPVTIDPIIAAGKEELLTKIITGREVCHHISVKLATLTDSNAFTRIQSVDDLKELQIHLSYLYTYAMGRFKTLHEKCMENLQELGYNSLATKMLSGRAVITPNKNNKSNNADDDDDEIEIIEPITDLINLDSDTDDIAAPPKTLSPSNVIVNGDNGPVTIENDPPSTIETQHSDPEPLYVLVRVENTVEKPAVTSGNDPLYIASAPNDLPALMPLVFDEPQMPTNEVAVVETNNDEKAPVSEVPETVDSPTVKVIATHDLSDDVSTQNDRDNSPEQAQSTELVELIKSIIDDVKHHDSLSTGNVSDLLTNEIGMDDQWCVDDGGKAATVEPETIHDVAENAVVPLNGENVINTEPAIEPNLPANERSNTDDDDLKVSLILNVPPLDVKINLPLRIDELE